MLLKDGMSITQTQDMQQRQLHLHLELFTNRFQGFFELAVGFSAAAKGKKTAGGS